MTISVPDFNALAQPGIQRLRAYDPGHDLVRLRRAFSDKFLVELGSNENSYGASPRAREAILDSLHELHRYPDPLGSELKGALATFLGFSPAQIMLGNGSHELLMMIAQVFAGQGDEVLASQFAFAVYALAAQAAGAHLVVAPALPIDNPMPRGHDLARMFALVTKRTRLVYIANPNNPTGTWFATEALAALLLKLGKDVLVVVDEAYLEYVTDPELISALSLLEKFPNLIVTRTFSKAYGLAGLRLGYACAHPELLAIIERVRESFNTNGPALAACRAALGDQDHVAWLCEKNAVERASLREQLVARGLQVAPSQTNFLLVDFAREAAAYESALMQRGVVPRPMIGYGLPGCLRITVGTRDENRRLLQALDEVLE